MKVLKEKLGWVFWTALGSFLYAFGFALFFAPNQINNGGISGLAMILQKLLHVGSVGTLSVILNIPLFILGGKKIGKKFYWGSLLGLVLSSVMIDALTGFPMPEMETLLACIYGGVLCGLGLGLVFATGTSTGGTDMMARLLKCYYRNVNMGSITIALDTIVVVLTGITFRDVTKALYSGIAVFTAGQVLDVVIYRFDYSKAALIVSQKYSEIAQAICIQLDRGATFLDGEGAFKRQTTKVVLTVVKKRQLAELKELVMEIDPNAFVIVQEAHQVLGEGFSRYDRNGL